MFLNNKDREWVFPKGCLLFCATRKRLLPSTRGICMSVTPGEQPRPHLGCFYCLSKWMFFQANCIVFQKEIHHTCLWGYGAGIKMMGWWVPGPKEKMLQTRGSSFARSFSRTRKSLEWKCSDWPWRNLSPGFDSQGILDTWETQPSHWELSLRLHRVQNQFTFVH